LILNNSCCKVILISSTQHILLSSFTIAIWN